MNKISKEEAEEMRDKLEYNDILFTFSKITKYKMKDGTLHAKIKWNDNEDR
jgi:hypothetical protein